MKRYYYGNSIANFCNDIDTSIIGELTMAHSHELDDLQKNAWLAQVQILKNQLIGLEGYIYFEFTIPRMGKRTDNILIIGDTVFVLEFKIGSCSFDKHAIDQTIDYSIDLKNFHEGSHFVKIIPVLIASEANTINYNISKYFDNVFDPLLVGKNSIRVSIININTKETSAIDPEEWVNSRYKPTPTIIQAAQALYEGHEVDEITRNDADAKNLSITTDCINKIIDNSKANGTKSICFVTGVPGAGKTLAGLNIAIERKNIDEDEHAVFLSGNGPLVDVLREALTRDEVDRKKSNGEKGKKDESYRKASSFIQNIHHFRDDALKTDKPPIEKVVVFDEAQRAWNEAKASDFMQKKRGMTDFNMSEPEFLISVMDRHEGACTIICLIGGGQEINTGEAGIEEWFRALQKSFSNWEIHYSKLIVSDDNYSKDKELSNWIQENGISQNDLHLGVSLRSFRSEKLSAFVKDILDIKISESKIIFQSLIKTYPIVITRNLEIAKRWLKNNSRGFERYGLVASSGALRLRPFGLNVKSKIDAPYWFLNGKEDIRSSYFMEEVATEFDIQGLELDWVGVCWDGDLSFQNDQWVSKNFTGTTWKNVNQEVDRNYLKNAYRVLLTRARQGMVLFIPEGNDEDATRLKMYYDGTFEYFKSLGLQEI